MAKHQRVAKNLIAVPDVGAASLQERRKSV
jgi:hypothetical protein